MSGRLIPGTNRARGRNLMLWSEYDRLPSPVRRVLMFAHTDLGTRRATVNLRIGKSVAEVCAIERAVAHGITRRDILAAYGPEHPFLSKTA